MLYTIKDLVSTLSAFDENCKIFICADGFSFDNVAFTLSVHDDENGNFMVVLLPVQPKEKNTETE